MFQPLYTATATAHGGREGKVQTDDGQVSHALAMPTALGGKGGPGTNPEQLFAAGYAACFESALRLVARLQKKSLKDATITAGSPSARPTMAASGSPPSCTATSRASRARRPRR